MRYELSDYEWSVIKPMLPNKPRGVPRVDDRRVLNGIFWVLRSGAPWRDLPENYGPHTTCYNRGLVVITSCGHGGIINAVRRAIEVSGVDKVYALVGGFHLAPAPTDYLAKIMAELKTLDIEHVFPMHCSGGNFVELAKREIPKALVLCTTGSQFTFAA